MFYDIPTSDLLFCAFGLTLVATYYLHQIYGPRCKLALLNILMRITSSQAFIVFWAVWLLLKPAATLIARMISLCIPDSIPHFLFYELPIFLSGRPATSRHNRRFNRQVLELVDATPDITPHSNATLRQWIDEDSANDSENRRLARAKERADAEAKDRQALLTWRLNNSLTSSPANPLINSILSGSWRTDPSPLASNTVATEVSSSLRNPGASLSPLLDEKPMAQLPDWLRNGPTSDGYTFGKLRSGSYVVRVPGHPQALHLDLERKVYSEVEGSLGKDVEESLRMERA